MYTKTEKVWMDGKLIRWEDANVHVMTHSLHYGLGAFEGIRYYDTGKTGSAVFRLDEHMRRFDDSCRILALKLKYTMEELIQACKEVVRANTLREGYLRPLAFISDGPNAGVWAYDNPSRMVILAWGWGAYLGAEGLKNGIKTRVSSFTRHHPNVAMTKAKASGQYFNSVLAKHEARMNGCDEAIMLDPEGYVAEGTGENLFIVRNGVVKTPPPGTILPGVTRETIIELCKDERIPIVEERLTRDDLYRSDEVFFTGTAAEVTPVREVDLRPVGKGVPGPITIKLQQIYKNLVHGKNPAHKDWLSFVEA